MRLDKDRPIRAYVMLRGSGGGLSSGAPISAGSVRQFVVDQPTRDRIKQALLKLGFSVRRSAAFSLTVEALSGQYEAVFHAPLDRKVHDHSESLDWGQPPTIPEELVDAVDAVVFPQPVQRMTS